MERTPNKSQHTKLTLEKKILPPLLPGFEFATFRSRVRRSNKQAISRLPSCQCCNFLQPTISWLQKNYSTDILSTGVPLSGSPQSVCLRPCLKERSSKEMPACAGSCLCAVTNYSWLDFRADTTDDFFVLCNDPQPRNHTNADEIG